MGNFMMSMAGGCRQIQFFQTHELPIPNAKLTLIVINYLFSSLHTAETSIYNITCETFSVFCQTFIFEFVHKLDAVNVRSAHVEESDEKVQEVDANADFDIPESLEILDLVSTSCRCQVCRWCDRVAEQKAVIDHSSILAKATIDFFTDLVPDPLTILFQHVELHTECSLFKYCRNER